MECLVDRHNMHYKIREQSKRVYCCRLKQQQLQNNNSSLKAGDKMR